MTGMRDSPAPPERIFVMVVDLILGKV